MVKYRWMILVVIAVVLLALPLLTLLDPEEAPAFLVELTTKDNLTLLFTLFIIAAMSSSWNILGGYVGHVNLGHVAFFGIGALVTRLLWLETGVGFPLAFSLGAITAAVAAVVIGAPALRLKGVYFAIGTLALAEAMRLTVGNVLPRVSRLPVEQLRDYDIVPRYYLALAVLIVIVATVAWLNHSRLGLGMMAVREDEEAARSIGVNTFLHSMIAFVLSAFFAGLVGGTFAYFHPSYYADYAFGPVWTFDAVIIAFIGGIGTTNGPLIGAVFFVLVRDVLSSSLEFTIAITETRVFEFKMSDYHLVIFGTIFILVVLTMPGGILEFADWLRQRWRAYRTRPRTP